jgi:hypothetical protein
VEAILAAFASFPLVALGETHRLFSEPGPRYWWAGRADSGE